MCIYVYTPALTAVKTNILCRDIRVRVCVCVCMYVNVNVCVRLCREEGACAKVCICVCICMLVYKNVRECEYGSIYVYV
jgi:hypothetical protein